MTDLSSSANVPDAAPAGSFAPVAPIPLAPAPTAVKRPPSASAVIAFVLVCLIAFGYMTVKLIVVALNTEFDSGTESLATVFGVLGLLSLVPIVAVIVLGHFAVRKATAQLRGRILGAVALGAGYVFLALYLNRIVVSIIAILEPHAVATFVQNNYYWL